MNNENKEEKKEDFPSELRYDVISGDWVVVATGRAKRPEMFKSDKKEAEKSSPEDCPFCDLNNISNALEIFEGGKKVDELTENWSAVSIPNKFPAFSPSQEIRKREEGDFFKIVEGIGYHEVVITKDHYASLGELPIEKVKEVFTLYRERYKTLKEKKNVNYISIFHNHGKEAGASITHPHSQILTTPLVDVNLEGYLSNTKKYYEEKGSCLHCDMNREEIKKQERIVYENESFLVVSPFAPKVAFQLVVTPKKHLSYFEEITDDELSLLADAFSKALSKLHKGLNNPPYNFYLHATPIGEDNYDYHHWHWTIVPKTSVWAGFELGAQMEISTIKPEDATKYLKEQ